MNCGCLSGYGTSLSQLYDDNKSLNDGVLKLSGFIVDGGMVRIFAAAGLDPDKPSAGTGRRSSTASLSR